MSEIISIAAARTARGLRMVGIAGVPSPWTEAAKGIFRIKQLTYSLARQMPEDEPRALVAWAGDGSIPVVAYENEKLRTGWAEILLLSERLAPTPALIPVDAQARALMFGISHEICGEMGFGWCARLLMIRAALDDGPRGDGAGGTAMSDKPRGFPPQVGNFLAPRYGFDPHAVAVAEDRLVALLGMLDGRLQQGAHLVGTALSAADVYWATFANLLTPLPEELMPMSAMARAAYSCSNPRLLEAMTQRLRNHQRFIYETHLELPVQL